MTRDPKRKHYDMINACEKSMEAIRQKKPHDFYNDMEWKRLAETVRWHNMRIERIQKMIDNGVKF